MTLDLQIDPVGPPPIEKGGPYDGALQRSLARLPGPIRGFLGEAGGTADLLGKVLWSAVRHPRGYWSDVVDEMHFTIKRSWIAVVLALFGFLLALSVPSMQWVTLAGIAELYGPLLFVQSTRTFTVWVATLLVAGVVGAAMTAELGSRKVREELDAMKVMGIDPIRTLVLPRIVSVTLMTTLLGIPAEIITILSSLFASDFIGGVDPANFFSFLWLTQTTVEVVAMVVNCMLAGLVIGAVCSYKGLSAQGGATGLGRAVNQAVVTCFVSLFVLQLGYNAVILGFFPNLGQFR